MFAATALTIPGRNQPAADASPAQPPQPGLTPQCLKEIEACHARNCRAVSQSYTPPSMEDGPTRTHTLHTIGSRADTRHTVTGRSTGSGLLDTQHTAHRTAHEVTLCSGVLGD